jgi:hypothetical protein
MPAFASWLVKLILDYVVGRLSELVRGLIARFNRHSAIDKQAEESKKPLEEAKNEKEIDDAAKDILGGL